MNCNVRIELYSKLLFVHLYPHRATACVILLHTKTICNEEGSASTPLLLLYVGVWRFNQRPSHDRVQMHSHIRPKVEPPGHVTGRFPRRDDRRPGNSRGLPGHPSIVDAERFVAGECRWPLAFPYGTQRAPLPSSRCCLQLRPLQYYLPSGTCSGQGSASKEWLKLHVEGTICSFRLHYRKKSGLFGG